ncbi:hypothetical protein LUX32_42225 [Actinomadura madurae]|nr:hypothetical protein [Actinomadura madurae]MCP9983485.1 hypothetical protein [Actinomadura madurae]
MTSGCANPMVRPVVSSSPARSAGARSATVEPRRPAAAVMRAASRVSSAAATSRRVRAAGGSAASRAPASAWTVPPRGEVPSWKVNGLMRPARWAEDRQDARSRSAAGFPSASARTRSRAGGGSSARRSAAASSGPRRAGRISASPDDPNVASSRAAASSATGSAPSRAGRVDERVRRRGVQPLRVVDEAEHGTSGARPAQQRQDGPARGEDVLAAGPAGLAHGAQPLGVGAAEVAHRPQHQVQGGERLLGLGPVAGAAQDEGAVRQAGRVVEQGALADALLAADDGGPAAPARAPATSRSISAHSAALPCNIGAPHAFGMRHSRSTTA